MRGRRAVASEWSSLLAVAAPAAAGPPGQWTRLPGRSSTSLNPGSHGRRTASSTSSTRARTGRRRSSPTSPSARGARSGPTAVALGGWSSMSHPDLLRMPDGTLRVFFGGIRSTNPGETNNAMNTATAPASGAQWTLKPGKAARPPTRTRRRTPEPAWRRTERRSRAGRALRDSGSTTESIRARPTARSRRAAAASTTPTSASTPRAVRPGSALPRTRPRAPAPS